ncbi:MAG: EamA family transporter RarD [Actinomycetes bacterium]
MSSDAVESHTDLNHTPTKNSTDSQTPDRSGIFAGVSAYLLWGFITVYWKALKAFAPLELIGYRILMSVVLLVVILAAKGRLTSLFKKLSSDHLWTRVACAALLLAVNWTTYVVVVHDGKVIEAALGYFIAPLGTMLIGVKVLHEKIRPIQLVSALLGLAAVVVLTISYGRIPYIALAMAASWALYGLLKRQVPLQPLESLMSETIFLVVPAVALIFWFSRYDDSVIQSANFWHIILVLLSGVVTAVPLLLFATAALKLPLTVLGPMQYSVPTINFLLGWLAYHEKMSPSRFVGFGLVWIALVIVTIDSIRRARRSSALS